MKLVKCDVIFSFFLFFFNCVNVFIGNLDATFCGRPYMYVSDLSYHFRLEVIILMIIFEISKSSS